MQQFTPEDHELMHQALALATAAKGITFPNPAVGAVVVKDGTVVGQGATACWGGPHAEKTALAEAGIRACGATLYVTLEPCCHYGKTPPCTDAVIAAGIRRVVVAVRDPNPLVAGKGIRQLRRGGVVVDAGLLKNKAISVNEDFFWAITQRRAFITLKLALTLDGRIADVKGDSKWITSPALRRIVHGLRRTHAAVAVGSGTLTADDPQLTVRFGKKAKPARIIFSSGEVLPRKSFFVLNARSARSIVVIRRKTERRIIIDAASGIEYWYTGCSGQAKSMAAFTEMAFMQNITSVFVEGGQRIASVLLEAGLVNRIYLFYGNQIVGSGTEGIRFAHGLPIDKSIVLRDRRSMVAGSDVYITGIPEYPGR